MTKTHQNPLGWTLSEWQTAYRQGQSAQALLNALLHSVRKQEFDNGCLKQGSVWIELVSDEQLAVQVDALSRQGNANSLPLYGVPFAVKDNIDVNGFATTAGCPEYAYEPAQDAEVVRLLREAGAIVLGKTNLDQFATGLVGTRSPYGAVPNPFNSNYVSGGSSSGSAVAVARGYVPFALGTDTAGSGRVPAGFNHLVGLKPSKGLLSTRGVVPACRSLDCVSIFSLNTRDAERVLSVAAHFDPLDGYSRGGASSTVKTIQRVAVPDDAPWFGDIAQKDAYQNALDQAKTLGYEIIPTDFSPFFELAALLYEGPWVAERYAAVGEFIEQDLPGINPVVKNIISAGKKASAVQAFNAEYRRVDLVRKVQQLFADFDALLVPSAPQFPTLADVAEQPVRINSELGTYTNFVNLADLSALAIPAGFRSDGLPFGVTLIAPAFCEPALLNFATRWEAALRLPIAPQRMGLAGGETVTLAVVGAHLSGMPLNHQLTQRNAVLLEQTRSAKKYQLYALANTSPPKPGLVRVNQTALTEGSAVGHEIVVELWQLSMAGFGSFVADIPQPMGIGTIELSDGRRVKGFICEPAALSGAENISKFGGWRAYISHLYP